MNILLKNFESHISSLPSRTKGMMVSKKSNITLVDSGLDSDTFNIIHITNGHHISESEIQAAVYHFEDKSHTYTIWIAKNQLNEKVKSIFAVLDLVCIDSTPGMKLNLLNYSPEADSSLHDIRMVSSPEDLKSYAQLIADQWSPGDKKILDYYDQTSRLILEKKLPIQYAIEYRDGSPVGGIEMCITADTLGIYGLATAKMYRKQGIGNALMTYALKYGKTKNLSNAVLQSSALGYGIYKKLGFKIMTEYFEYGHQLKI
jgi:ribosomal protein S18 acetylase RimI-like enzyme